MSHGPRNEKSCLRCLQQSKAELLTLDIVCSMLRYYTFQQANNKDDKQTGHPGLHLSYSNTIKSDFLATRAIF